MQHFVFTGKEDKCREKRKNKRAAVYDAIVSCRNREAYEVKKALIAPQSVIDWIVEKSGKKPIDPQKAARWIIKRPNRNLRAQLSVKERAVQEKAFAKHSAQKKAATASAEAEADRLIAEAEDAGSEESQTDTPMSEEEEKARLRSKAIHLANQAINALSRIPKNDINRKRGFQIVTDWIRKNK